MSEPSVIKIINGGKMEWISVKESIPHSCDDSVFVYFSGIGSVDVVHIQDYFDDITSGFDDEGNQIFTKWYKSQKVTHWMALPNPPKGDTND